MCERSGTAASGLETELAQAAAQCVGRDGEMVDQRFEIAAELQVRRLELAGLEVPKPAG